MLVYAHRGFSAQAPENTLASFQAALDAGADGVELDVTLSADGVPVVMHDDTLERTTTGHGLVWRQPLSLLRTLDAGVWFGPGFAGERVPTLEEVLALLPTIEVNVEIKGGRGAPSGLPAAVHRVLDQHAEPERIIVSSFDPRMLRSLRRLDRRWRIALLFGDRGLLARSWRIWARALDPEFLHPKAEILDTVLETEDPARINVWTVNEPDAMLQMAKRAVRGIITDDPVLARTTLEKQRG